LQVIVCWLQILKGHNSAINSAHVSAQEIALRDI
jgi:hypothetical protein